MQLTLVIYINIHLKLPLLAVPLTYSNTNKFGKLCSSILIYSFYPLHHKLKVELIYTK